MFLDSYVKLSPISKSAVDSPDQIQAALDCWWDWGFGWDVAALGLVAVLVGNEADVDHLALGRRPADLPSDFVGLVGAQVLLRSGFLAENAVISNEPLKKTNQ